jgi:Spherulation-specific family 4
MNTRPSWSLRNYRRFSPLTFGALCGLLSACGEREPLDPIEARQGALTSTMMGITVPAYWPASSADSPYWQDIISNWQLVDGNSVIVNGPNSHPPPDGPQSPLGIAMANRIAQIHSQGNHAIGYVNINRYNPNSAVKTEAQIYADLALWKAYGLANGLDGIFFDDAQRLDDTELQNTTWYAAYVYMSFENHYSGPYAAPIVVFNWGAAGYVASTGLYCAVACPAGQTCSPTGCYQGQVHLPQYIRPMRRYVDCLLNDHRAWFNEDSITNMRFVTQETTFSYYTTTATSDWSTQYWNWVNAYHPKHFIHMVHSLTPTTNSSTADATVADLINKGAARNAAWLYYTDQVPAYVTLPNRIQPAPPPPAMAQYNPLWNSQLAGAYYVWKSFPGPDNDPSLPTGVVCP